MGRLVTLYQVGIVLGILAAVFMNMLIQRMGDETWNTAVGWRWMFLTGLFPAIIFAVMILPAPESPRWLMKMGRNSEAVVVLTRINGAEIASREAQEIQESLSMEEGHLSELLTTFRRPLLVGIMLASFSQISGITAVLSFLPEVFQAAGTATGDAFLQSVLVGIVNLVFTLMGLWLVDLTGRKTLIIVGCFLQFVSFAMVGLLFHMHGSGHLLGSLRDDVCHRAWLRKRGGLLGHHFRDISRQNSRSGYVHRHHYALDLQLSWQPAISRNDESLGGGRNLLDVCRRGAFLHDMFLGVRARDQGTIARTDNPVLDRTHDVLSSLLPRPVNPDSGYGDLVWTLHVAI